MSTPALWRLLDEATNVAEQQLCHASASAPRQHARAILASFQQNGTCNASSHWRRMGHSAQVPEQVETLANLVRGEAGPKVCCEVGFNAGHSALVWLEGGCQRLIEFDFLREPYSATSRAFVEKTYPGRVTFVRGSSMFSLENHLKNVLSGKAPACDLWMVDGNHGPEGKPSTHPALLAWPGRDLTHAIKASADGALVIADDCTERFPDVQRAWAKLQSLGSLHGDSQIKHALPEPIGVKGWCVGRANATLTRSAKF